MCNQDRTTRLNDKKLLELFRKACDKHDKLMSEARENRGCDRHLLGLMLTSQELNLDLPAIYTDESWTKSGGGGNFVISSSCLGFTNVNGGCAAMCTNGYTMIYCFSDYGYIIILFLVIILYIYFQIKYFKAFHLLWVVIKRVKKQI